jgi:7-cyano-7-deazaguanine synthase
VNKAILLLSGGLDSATCGVVARDMGFEVCALSFSYGQRHALELLSARKTASFLGIREHRVIDIDPAIFGGNALTSTDADVPKDRCGTDSAIPATYVPARNTIFLAYALAWAEVIRSRDIFIGVNCIDYSGYPDCRPEFIAAFQKMANLAVATTANDPAMTIHAPLMHCTKAEIIKIGTEAHFDYSITHSCYDPDDNGAACGRCDSCRLRKKGFEQAGVPDPTRYSV